MARVARSSEEILPEDYVTNALIQQVDGITAVEVPYNNYGERGYADLVRSQNDYTQVIEVKSNPESANSVIRQYNKMKNNFIDGSDYDDLKPSNTDFKLVFTASHRNLEHLKQNKNMYLTLNSPVCIADEQGKIVPVWDSEGNLRKSSLNKLKGIRIEEELICPICGKEYRIEAYFRQHVKGCFA